MEILNIFCLTGQRGKKWHILQGFADHGATQKCKASEKQGSKKKNLLRHAKVVLQWKASLIAVKQDDLKRLSGVR
jgi:hypothetical protein